jgi:hypothetical protein
MSEQLKREYDLIVLKVEVVQTHPDVLFTLQAKVDGALTDVMRWSSDVTTLELLRDRTSTVRCQVPLEVRTGILDWVQANTEGMPPLWVHLVKPYGALRFMPWERAFGDGFPMPILMLPDFLFPPPREASDTLDIALLASAPLNVEDGLVRQALQNTVGGIITAAVRKTALHVFADQDMYREMRTLLSLVSSDAVEVTLYDPKDAAEYVDEELSSRTVDATGQLRSPWLLWMRDQLHRNSVDVVHFVGHGSLTRDRGALLVAQSPLQRTDDFRAGPISAVELATFMTQVGAWGTAISASPQNNSEPGLRALADEIGQTRPGPVFMQNMDREPSPLVMASAYRLLFDTESVDLPRSDALFIYCQPYRLRNAAAPSLEIGTQRSVRSDITLESPVSRSVSQTQIAEAASAGVSPLDSVIGQGTAVKPWVAATERVAEQVMLKLQATVRDETDDDNDQQVRQQVTERVLASLRASVAGFASVDAEAAKHFVVPILPVAAPAVPSVAPVAPVTAVTPATPVAPVTPITPTTPVTDNDPIGRRFHRPTQRFTDEGGQ